MRQEHPAFRALDGAARAVLIAFVYLYKAISEFTPGSCRFQPSCSSYALTAIRRHGALRGGWLTLRRLTKCHPLGSWGYDPVPERRAGDGDRGRQAACGCPHSLSTATRARRAGDREELA